MVPSKPRDFDPGDLDETTDTIGDGMHSGRSLDELVFVEDMCTEQYCLWL